VIRWARTSRIRGFVGFALVSPALFVSGCSLLLDIQTSAEGPCASSLDCPVLESCVDNVCRPDVPADASVGDSVADAPTRDGESGASFDAGLAPDANDANDAPDAPDAPDSETACSAADEAGDDDGCGVCDTSTHACIGGVCRELLWTSPESNLGEPQAAYESRQYQAVDAGVVHAVAIAIDNPGQLLRIGFLASSTQPQAAFQIGLYDDDMGYPDHLVYGSPLQESAVYDTSDGRQEIAVPECPRVHLASGTYWITFAEQSIPAVQGGFVFQSTGGNVQTVEVPYPDGGSPWVDPFPLNAPMPAPMFAPSIIVYVTVAADPP
jgi:hypothetical protein